MKNRVKLIIPMFLGTLLEWYEFSIFAFLAPIFSELFFPMQNKLSSSLLTYAVFAIGFIVRPLGAFVFGYYADNYGRKKSMFLSMMLMTIATTSIGLLPTYSQIGIYASLSLVLFRLVQGFCVGGESTGAALYIIESCQSRYRGMLCSFMWSAVGFGILMGSFVSTLTSYLFTSEELSKGIWRLPFLISILGGIVSLYFRKKIPETILYDNYKKERKSFRKIINGNKKAIINIIFLYAMSSIITYILFIFTPSYISNSSNLDIRITNIITTISLFCVTIFVPLSGFLSDLLGRKICLYIGASGFLLLSIPLYFYIYLEKTFFSFIISNIVFVIFSVLYQGSLTAAVQEIPTTCSRFTITSVGYHVSYGIFGGTAPFMVIWLSNLSGSAIAPGIYLSFFSCLALMAIYNMKETYKIKLV